MGGGDEERMMIRKEKREEIGGKWKKGNEGKIS